MVSISFKYRKVDLVNNLYRLGMAVQGIDLKLKNYQLLRRSKSDPYQEYDASSNINKRQIYSVALSIVESTANNPTLMKSYRSDDITVTDLAESIQNRISQLEYKIRMMPTNDDKSKTTNTFMLFSS